MMAGFSFQMIQLQFLDEKQNEEANSRIPLKKGNSNGTK